MTVRARLGRPSRFFICAARSARWGEDADAERAGAGCRTRLRIGTLLHPSTNPGIQDCSEPQEQTQDRDSQIVRTKDHPQADLAGKSSEIAGEAPPGNHPLAARPSRICDRFNRGATGPRHLRLKDLEGLAKFEPRQAPRESGLPQCARQSSIPARSCRVVDKQRVPLPFEGVLQAMKRQERCFACVSGETDDRNSKRKSPRTGRSRHPLANPDIATPFLRSPNFS